MKPDWDKLSAEYADSKTVVIADVDCTAGGKAKCEEVGIRGYPSIKYGDPDDLTDYKGGRTLADLQKFAEGLGPACGPANIELCDGDKKTMIQQFTKFSETLREKMIKEKEAEMEGAEKDFKAYVDGLQKEYQDASDNKDKAVEAIKSGGLGLLNSVHAYENKQKSEL